MTLGVFVWSLTLFWAAVYAIKASRKSIRSSSLLPPPFPNGNTPHRRLHTNSLRHRQCKLALQNFHLKAQTTALNTHHDALSAFLAQPSGCGKLLRRVLKTYYDIGSILGLVGMAAAIGGLGVVCYQALALNGTRDIAAPTHDANLTFEKRGVNAIYLTQTVPASQSQATGFGIHPIIPGVTVPWSHLSILLIALFFVQCIHEAGHAIAAAVDVLPLHSIGASITLILPSAFVALSPSHVPFSPFARLRVASAGSFHNLVLCGVIYLASDCGLRRGWEMIGWKDVSGMGVGVISVEADSPLVHHLFSGDIITHLDDVYLSSEGGNSEQRWTKYLLSSHGPSANDMQGWCIEESYFASRPTDCCIAKSTSRPPAAQLSCFVPIPINPGKGSDEGHCTDPFDVLVSDTIRCSSTLDCNSASEKEEAAMRCIRPHSRERLMRIIVRSSTWSREESGGIKERVVLWSGPKEEVWDQVSVGTLLPRYQFLLPTLPDYVELFFGYISTLSLSLYFFNLLALPFLDGSQVLGAMLDWVCCDPSRTDSSIDAIPLDDLVYISGIDDIEHGGSTPSKSLKQRHSSFAIQTLERWQRWIRRRRVDVERSVYALTSMLLFGAVVGMASSLR